MWFCRGNGAQVHHSERDPETRTAACEMQLDNRVCYVSLFFSVECFMWCFPVLGNQSGSVQYQHRRALCHPQRVYPFTVLQVSLLTSVSALSVQHQLHLVTGKQVSFSPAICYKILLLLIVVVLLIAFWLFFVADQDKQIKIHIFYI